MFLDFLLIWGQLILIRNRCLLPFSPACLFRKKINCCVQYNQIYLLSGTLHAEKNGSPIILTWLISLFGLEGYPFLGALRATNAQTRFSCPWRCTVLKTLTLSHDKPTPAPGEMWWPAGFFLLPWGPDKSQFGVKGRRVCPRISPSPQQKLGCDTGAAWLGREVLMGGPVGTVQSRAP